MLLLCYFSDYVRCYQLVCVPPLLFVNISRSMGNNKITVSEIVFAAKSTALRTFHSLYRRWKSNIPSLCKHTFKCVKSFPNQHLLLTIVFTLFSCVIVVMKSLLSSPFRVLITSLLFFHAFLTCIPTCPTYFTALHNYYDTMFSSFTLVACSEKQLYNFSIRVSQYSDATISFIMSIVFRLCSCTNNTMS